MDLCLKSFSRFCLLIISFSLLQCELLDPPNTSDGTLELYGDNPFRIYDGSANSCDGNDDSKISQGESFRVQLRATNTGDEDVDGVKMKITSSDNYVEVVSGASQTLGDMKVNHYYSTPEANNTASILLKVQTGTPNGHIADIDVKFEDNSGNEWQDQFNIIVQPIDVTMILYGSNPWRVYDGNSNEALGNDNEQINAGEKVRIQLRVQNNGHSNAKLIKMVARINDEYVSIIDDSTYTFGDIDSFHYKTTPEVENTSALLLLVNDDTPSGYSTTINVYFEDKYNNEWQDSFDIIVQ